MGGERERERERERGESMASLLLAQLEDELHDIRHTYD
jgi:hypothetical protein